MSIVHATKETFNEEVKEGLVLIDFWAPWCGPCKMLGPALEEVSKELGDKLKIVKVNVDEEQELGQAFQIMSIPTMVLARNGEGIEGTQGYAPKEAIVEWVKKHM